MKQIQLRGTPLVSSALGFGCVSLASHESPERAQAVLQAAFDAGVTHFDVARAYGFGQCEQLLGRFLRGRRDRVTVATKFGLHASPALSRQRRLVGLARWAVRRSPLLQRIAHRATAVGLQRGAFGPADAAASLETSLRELATDYIDLFLLHECTLSDASRDDLIAFLEQQVQLGRVRCFGPSTSYDKLGGDASLWPAAYRVLQFDSSALARNVRSLQNADSRALVTFAPIARARWLAESAAADPAFGRAHSDRVGIDLSDPAVVAGLMLGDALASNPDGVVLFATTRPERVQANITGASQVRPAALRTAFESFAAEAVARATARG